MTDFATEIKTKGFIVYTNKGDSMLPLLREDRDLIVISEIKEPLRRNDTVLFRRENGAYVLHRIIKTGNGEHRIGGDNRVFSEMIPESAVIGVMTEIIRDGRHIRVTDEEYRRYLKKLPGRRFRLKCRTYPYIFYKKIRNRIRRRTQ